MMMGREASLSLTPKALN